MEARVSDQRSFKVFPNMDEQDFKHFSRCSGSLIADRVILTAGHCIVATLGDLLPSMFNSFMGQSQQNRPVKNGHQIPIFQVKTNLKGEHISTKAGVQSNVVYSKPYKSCLKNQGTVRSSPDAAHHQGGGAVLGCRDQRQEEHSGQQKAEGQDVKKASLRQ